MRAPIGACIEVSLPMVLLVSFNVISSPRPYQNYCYVGCLHFYLESSLRNVLNLKSKRFLFHEREKCVHSRLAIQGTK